MTCTQGGVPLEPSTTGSKLGVQKPPRSGRLCSGTAGEGTLEEVTILDLEGRREGRRGSTKARGSTPCIHCSMVFLEDLLCAAAIGVDTVPAIADGETDEQTH